MVFANRLTYHTNLYTCIYIYDLQLLVQSVHITTVVNSNPAHGKVYSIQHYVIKFVSFLQVLPYLEQQQFFELVVAI
jgi:hypothetical protein